MSDSNPAGDRNLLFGILALQAGVISESQLLAAMKQWPFAKEKSLGEILVDQSVISADQLALINPMVDAQVKLFGNNPAQALNSISAVPDITFKIQNQITDRDVQTSLSNFRTLSVSDSSKESGEPAARPAGRASDQRFRIVRPHAKGGLGEVFVALDTELNREVALKEIQGRFADQRQSRNRFVLEAEITGGLEHPGIVPVYGLGSYADGRPYYAMRFIKGDSLKEAIQHFHQAQLTDSERSLELRKLLGRFVDVCQAIGYAHSRGVLHRDLKPGNIMLGKYGETLVVDWGLAKAVGRDDETGENADEATMHPSSGSNVNPTIMGSAIGTPAFMPPEQASGRTDLLGPQSDIYSLGATLYYLLTGKPPFAGPNVNLVLDQVRRGEFVPPRSLVNSIPAELNAICLKAMSREVTDRYPSTDELADDIEKFLADEAVSAMPEPVSVKVRRWIRKHPTMTTSTAAAVMISTIGLIVFSTVVSGKNAELARVNSVLDEKKVALERTNTELDEKNAKLVTSIQNESVARQQAQQNEKIAEQNYKLARDSVDKYFTTVSENQLLNEPYMDGLRKELLTSASEFYQSFVEQRRNDPTALSDLSSAQLNLGNLSWEIGDAEKAISTLESALSSLSQVTGTVAADLEIGLLKLKINLRLGGFYFNVGRAEDALATLDGAIASASELKKTQPESEQLTNLLARLLSSRGQYFYRNDKWELAIQDYQAVVELLQDRISMDDDPLNNVGVLAKSYTDLGVIYFRQQDSPNAATFYKLALELRRSAAASQPRAVSAQSGLADALTMTSQYYRRGIDLDEALQMAEEAVEIIKTAAEAHPELASLQLALVTCNSNLAIVHQVRDDFDAADLINDESGEVLKSLILRHPTMLAYQYSLGTIEGNRGNTCLSRKKFNEAISWYEQSTATLEAFLEKSPDDPRAKNVIRNNHWGRADALVALGEFAKAVEEFDQTLVLAQERSRPEIRMARAMALARGGDYRAAAEAVAEEMKLDETSAMIQFDAARVLVAAIGKIETDQAIETEQRESLLDETRIQAVSLLRSSFEREYLKKDDRDSPLLDDEFESLQDLPDFQQLLKDAGHASEQSPGDDRPNEP